MFNNVTLTKTPDEIRDWLRQKGRPASGLMQDDQVLRINVQMVVQGVKENPYAYDAINKELAEWVVS